MYLFAIGFEFSGQRRMHTAQLLSRDVGFYLPAQRLHRRTELSDLSGIDFNGMFLHCVDGQTIAINRGALAVLQLI